MARTVTFQMRFADLPMPTANTSARRNCLHLRLCIPVLRMVVRTLNRSGCVLRPFMDTHCPDERLAPAMANPEELARHNRGKLLPRFALLLMEMCRPV